MHVCVGEGTFTIVCEDGGMDRGFEKDSHLVVSELFAHMKRIYLQW